MLETRIKTLGNRNNVPDASIGGSPGSAEKSVRPNTKQDANPIGMNLADLCFSIDFGRPTIWMIKYPMVEIVVVQKRIIKRIVIRGKTRTHIDDCVPIISANALNPFIRPMNE